MIIPQRSYQYLNGQDDMVTEAANNLTDRRSSARTTSKKKKKSKNKKAKKSESPSQQVNRQSQNGVNLSRKGQMMADNKYHLVTASNLSSPTRNMFQQ